MKSFRRRRILQTYVFRRHTYAHIRGDVAVTSRVPVSQTQKETGKEREERYVCMYIHTYLRDAGRRGGDK